MAEGSLCACCGKGRPDGASLASHTNLAFDPEGCARACAAGSQVRHTPCPPPLGRAMSIAEGGEGATRDKIVLISGNSHVDFSRAVAASLGIPLSPMLLVSLSSGETSLTIGESIRGCDVFIIQSCAPGRDECSAAPPCPVCPSEGAHAAGGCACQRQQERDTIHDYIIELCLVIGACRAGSARRITAVLPCFPYARQDKKDSRRTGVGAKLLADMVALAGATHVITVELHSPQIVGFFGLPTDNLIAEPLFLDHIRRVIMRQADGAAAHRETPSVVIVAPDAGGVSRCASIAGKLGVSLAVIHKERVVANRVARMRLVGSVHGSTGIIIDDMADTCGTLCMAASLLRESGCTAVYAIVVHPILSGGAVRALEQSDVDCLVVTNTVALSPAARASPKIVCLDIAPLIGNVIGRIHRGHSISALFASAL